MLYISYIHLIHSYSPSTKMSYEIGKQLERTFITHNIEDVIVNIMPSHDPVKQMKALVALHLESGVFSQNLRQATPLL